MTEEEFDNFVPDAGKNVPPGFTVRHDQTMMHLISDLHQEATLLSARYGRADNEGAYISLQRIMATGSELMKGFGLEPDCKIVAADVNAQHFTEAQLAILEQSKTMSKPKPIIELDEK